MNTQQILHRMAIVLLLTVLSLNTTACGAGALYTGLAVASVGVGGATWYLAGVEMDAVNAKDTFLQKELNAHTYACDGLKEHVANVMIERGYSYSFESTDALHISDWDYFRPKYDDQWNKIHDGGRRRLLFEVTQHNQNKCQLTAFTQTLYSNASDAKRDRELDIEMALLQRIDPN
ncbi:MAG: hypothetical protein AAFX99_11580, partial [Myxococcota bacterium]